MRRISLWLLTITLFALYPILKSVTRAQAPADGAKSLAARAHDSGFSLSHDSYNAIGTASNGISSR